MKRLIFFFLLSLLSPCIYAQDLWSVTSSSDATSESNDIVIDQAGYSYITGYISGDTEFQKIEIDMSTGYSNAFVAKIDPKGKYEWVKVFGGQLADKGIKLVLTPTGEIIFTGTYYGEMTLGTTTLTAQGGSKDIFLAKLDANGDVIWARSEGGSMGDNPYGLALDQLGNIVLTGQFQGTSTIGTETFTSIIDPLTGLYSYEMFLAKYDTNGNPLWSKASYAEYEDRGIAVTCDLNNNIYLTGQFSDTIVLFGQTVNNAIYNTGFVARFDPAGNMIWFDKLAAAQVLAYDIELDNDQNLVLTGDFLGQMAIWTNDGFNILSNPYSRKIFVMKLGLNGQYIWGVANGSEAQVSSRSIAVDSNNDLYIGGYFRCNFGEYRDATGTAHWTSVGYRDIFVSKFNSTGVLQWKTHAGGQLDDVCWGIAITEVDHPIYTGSYAKNLFVPMRDGYNLNSYITNPGSQNYVQENNSGTNYVGVLGDASINVIASKLLNKNSGQFNYYQNLSAPNDSLPMYIIPEVDSVDFCPFEYACFETNMSRYKPIVPLLVGKWNIESENFVWNEPLDPYGHPKSWCIDTLQRDGMYTLTVDRMDGCYGMVDSIYIDYHPYPELPTLTDDHVTNDHTKLYQSITVCPPDPLEFYFEDLCQTCTNQLTITNLDDNSTYYSGPVVDGNVHQVNFNARIFVETTSDQGCKRTGSFNYSYYKLKSYDAIKPYLILKDTFDYNDSIMICRKDTVIVIAADSITNPTGLFVNYAQPNVWVNNRITYKGNLVATSLVFIPDSTGWYVVEHATALGFLETPCQALDTTVYTVVDSFYVDIREEPDLDFIGVALLCPDEYNYLSVDELLPDMEWYGPAILWTSSDKDSIRFNDSGKYGITGMYDYGEVTCPFDKSVYIGEKQAPYIIMDPVNGIVCPYDSVHMTIGQVGLSYDWLGPEGFTISTDDNIYAKDQGFYSCIFTDLDGCQLLTPPAEIKEYITPFIELVPSNVICGGESVFIYAIYGGNAQVNWLAPLNSTADKVSVSQAGTYTCEISECGVTVIDSVVIVDGSFTVDLNYSEIKLCSIDTLIVSATFGLSYYEWSNGIINTPFLEVTEPGEYWVKAWNEYGCEAISDSVVITGYPDSYPPLIDGESICFGDDVTLSHVSPYTLVWYADSAASPILTGETISLTNIERDTVLFASYVSAFCPRAFTEIVIDVLDRLTPADITGNLSHCVGQTLNLAAPGLTERVYRWVYEGDTVSYTNELMLSGLTSLSDKNIELFVWDKCSNYSIPLVLAIFDPALIQVSKLADTLCIGEQLNISSLPTGVQNYVWSDGTSTWTTSDLSVNYNEIQGNTIWVYGTDANACNTDTLEIALTLSTPIDFDLNLIGLTCIDNSISLEVNAAISNVTWALPDGTDLVGGAIEIPYLTKNLLGYYKVTYTDQLACEHRDSILVEGLDLPTFSLGNDTVICLSEVQDLLVPLVPYTFVWNGTDTLNFFRPTEDGPIILTAIDQNGCVFSDTIIITLADCDGSGANVVTPNGDGVNEYFTIFNAGTMPNNYIRIFNRWGNLVFEEEFYRNTYSPTELTDGVYFYEFYPDGLGGRKLMDYFHVIKNEP